MLTQLSLPPLPLLRTEGSCLVVYITVVIILALLLVLGGVPEGGGGLFMLHSYLASRQQDSNTNIFLNVSLALGSFLLSLGEAAWLARIISQSRCRDSACLAVEGSHVNSVSFYHPYPSLARRGVYSSLLIVVITFSSPLGSGGVPEGGRWSFYATFIFFHTCWRLR